MHCRRVQAAVILLFVFPIGASVANGCSAVPGSPGLNGSIGSGGGAASSAGHGGAGAGALHASTTVAVGVGGTFPFSLAPGGGGAAGGQDGGFAPACDSQCGPVELCDPAHLGLDDDCNGLVDEGCACQAGQAHFCFEGDPSYRGVPGCFDGTELCTEQGHYGPCIGGVHAVPPDNCFLDDTSACHAITAAPYADVHLAPGTGNFSGNAVPGSESYVAQCPSGVSQCPAVMALDDYKPLQSGEYTITYSKLVQGDPTPKSCTFPLLVGAPGLRVELSWEHSAADIGVDLDLHVHQPMNTQPWGISPGVPQDCTWSNCVVNDFHPPQLPSSPRWFADPPAMPPAPVNWYDDLQTPANNTCYDDPKGVGAAWAQIGLGCHDPRLDTDQIDCDFSVTDSNDYGFCTPENINIDYPPTGQWIRIAVHYYNNHGLTYDVHPEIKIFCDGALSADLGPHGYWMPEAPVTFKPEDGAGVGGNRFWVVADVAFTADKCGGASCTVRPVYDDATLMTPFFRIDDEATTTFAPDYPPPP
jgi:hypothetical protein